MGKSIMVIDDDRVSSEIVKRKLQEAGYDIATAIHGEDALAQLNKKPVDLILLDVEMPVMNGYTFITQRAQIPALKPIPVIVLTAHKENKPLFQRHSVRAYLLKPLNLQELLDQVAKVIGPA